MYLSDKVPKNPYISTKNEELLFYQNNSSSMVEVVGFEPTAFWSRTKRATRLRYTSSLEPIKGLEPLT